MIGSLRDLRGFLKDLILFPKDLIGFLKGLERLREAWRGLRRPGEAWGELLSKKKNGVVCQKPWFCLSKT